MPWDPNRFGPIWSVPMHGAIVSSLLAKPTVIDGVEKSTSHVTHRMLAPFWTRLSASARVWSGFSWVLAIANLI